MKVCFIVCWYGKFPNFFNFWQYSCSLNEKYDFLIFTDQKIESKYRNIKIINLSKREINLLFSQKLNMNINIEKPYKFCDFRPAYGILFEDYLKEYSFWGHCDIDQIFGNINKFLNDDILKKYERINHLGHFCLYKNNNKLNNLYKKDGSPFSYKEVFLSKENFAFDEITGIDLICKKNNVKQYEIKNFADLDRRVSRYKFINRKNYINQYFEYDKGSLNFVYYCDSKKNVEEIMYLHFQRKKPCTDNLNYDKKIYIGSNGFSNNLNLINKYSFKENFELFFYYLKMMKDFICSSIEKKIIWIKQKNVRK